MGCAPSLTIRSVDANHNKSLTNQIQDRRQSSLKQETILGESPQVSESKVSEYLLARQGKKREGFADEKASSSDEPFDIVRRPNETTHASVVIPVTTADHAVANILSKKSEIALHCEKDITEQLNNSNVSTTTYTIESNDLEENAEKYRESNDIAEVSMTGKMVDNSNNVTPFLTGVNVINDNSNIQDSTNKIQESSTNKVQESLPNEIEDSSTKKIEENSSNEIEESSTNEIEVSSTNKVEESLPNEIEDSSTKKNAESSTNKIEDSSTNEFPKPTNEIEIKSEGHSSNPSSSITDIVKISNDLQYETNVAKEEDLIKEQVDKVDNVEKCNQMNETDELIFIPADSLDIMSSPIVFNGEHMESTTDVSINNLEHSSVNVATQKLKPLENYVTSDNNEVEHINKELSLIMNI